VEEERQRGRRLSGFMILRRRANDGGDEAKEGVKTMNSKTGPDG